jgi:hypothetical protein
MSKFFSKYLGKFALMTAAALWAGCNDTEEKKVCSPIELKKIDTSKYQDSIRKITVKPREEIFHQALLYGVLPDVVRKGDDGKPVPRCRIKPLSAKNVVVEGRDIDVQTFLKVYRQRVHGLRFICDKNVKRRSDLASEFEGRIVLTLKIASSGEVENVQIKSTTIAENSPFSAMNEEIKESVSRWIFPKTQRGGTFTFPVNLYEVIPSAASSASEQPLSPTE